MFKLKDRIFHHSEKFKALIESQSDVELMETDDYGWENYRYESPLFRLAHVERYSHMGLEVVHITCFPRENSKAPVFGFIFKMVGFFFLLSLIFKMVNTVLFFLNGGRLKTPSHNNTGGNQLDNDDHFDDFEEL